MNAAHSPSKQAVLVNDDPAMLKIISGLLRSEFEHIHAHTSVDQALRAMSRNPPPDLIITDLYMPCIDGWRFCRLLRSPDYPAYNKTPVLVVSATFHGEEAARVTAETGADAFEPIPFVVPRFLDTVRGLLRGVAKELAHPVLIVEDSRTLANLLQREFTAHGYQAHVAATGEQARQLFAAHLFELVILDYHLPDVRGDILLEEFLRLKPEAVCIIMTSDSQPEIALECTTKGAAAYVRKPFTSAYLLELCAKARREKALLRVEERLEERTRELRASEARYRSVLENMLDVYYRTDTSGILTLVSPSALSMLGYTALEDIIGQPASAFYSNPRDRDRLLQHLNRHGAVLDFEVTLLRKDKTPIHVSTNSRFYTDEQGSVLGVEGTFRDITERRKAQAARARAESRYQELFENAPLAIFRSTPEGRFIEVNPKYAELTGHATPTEMIRHVQDIGNQLYAHPKERERYTSLLESQGFVHNYQVQLKRRDGSLFWASMNTKAMRDVQGRVISYDGFLSDITQEKQLEAQLRQALKAEALGTLTGGIAHDFNNILQAINGMTQLLLSRGQDSDPDSRGLHTISKCCDRGAQLIRQLLSYSRKAEGQHRPMDLNREITEAVSVLRRTIPRMITINANLEPDLPTIHGDPVQIEQILLNLGSNAADAMPEGGELTIATSIPARTRSSLDSQSLPRDPDFVQLTVADTGMGMDEATQQKIFDPFFTTKSVDKGTGLGLASVYGAMQTHHGRISCASAPGQGTVFTLFFPIAPGQPEQEAPPSSPATLPREQSGSILVVDDDDLVRETTVEALKSFGYLTREAASGEQALEIRIGEGCAFDLIILDLNMPGMGGRKTLDALLAHDPGARVLIASGYTVDGHGYDLLSAGAAGFISKPYQLEDLARKIKILMDGTHHGSLGGKHEFQAEGSF